MNERLFFLSPTSSRGSLGSSSTFFGRNSIDFSRSSTSRGNIFIELAFFFEEFLITFLTDCWHILTFLLAVIARVKFDLIFPFLYAIIVVKLLLRVFWRGGFFYYQPDFDFIYLHLSPFYRQIFNLLPLLLCFYYITLAWKMSRLFSDFFDVFLKVFHR